MLTNHSFTEREGKKLQNLSVCVSHDVTVSFPFTPKTSSGPFCQVTKGETNFSPFTPAQPSLHINSSVTHSPSSPLFWPIGRAFTAV